MTHDCGTSNAQRARASDAAGDRCAAIRWKIGAVAGRRAFGVPARQLEMLVRESGGVWSGLVRVIGEPDAKTISERPIEVEWRPDPELGLLHIDAPGFVRATIDTTNGTPRLLYARSALLNDLGLAGGRYEPEGTELGPEPDTES